MAETSAIAEPAAVRSAVLAVRSGDSRAFAVLCDTFQERLFGLVLMMTRDPGAAEELTQDAFVRAFRHLDRYDQDRPFYPWLATIATRLAQTWLRQRARSQARDGGPLDVGRYSTDSSDPLEALIADESSRRLWRAVSALPSGERTAVFMHYRDGMKVAEVADALGVTSGTIKTLLFRARKRLRGTYDSWRQTGGLKEIQ